MHPMLPLMALALFVSTFLVMALLWYFWYCQEGKKSEDREEHIYVIRVTKQQHELLKHAAEKKNVSGKKSSVTSKKNTEPTYPSPTYNPPKKNVIYHQNNITSL